MPHPFLGAKEAFGTPESVGKPPAVSAVEAGPRAFAIILVILVDGICRALPRYFRGGDDIFRILNRTAEGVPATVFFYLPHGQ